jgi:hypothetical protein
MNRIMELVDVYANDRAEFVPISIWKSSRAAIQAEVARMEAELEAALKDRVALAADIERYVKIASDLAAENETLRTEKKAREDQKPHLWIDEYAVLYKSRPRDANADHNLHALYLSAGAKARVPDGWQLVPVDQDEHPQMANACQAQIVREFGVHSNASLGYFKRIVSAAIAAAPEVP